MSAKVQSFASIVGSRPRIVILGSMPGVASLEAVQYYAHPRNAFWPIMGRLFDFEHEVEYVKRVATLELLPLILWDSLQSCVRPGSLDSAIDMTTTRANDFPGLFAEHAGIRAVFCNGATSEKYFRRLALPALEDRFEFDLVRLPSTSPANAGMKFEQKLDAWRRILDYV